MIPWLTVHHKTGRTCVAHVPFVIKKYIFDFNSNFIKKNKSRKVIQKPIYLWPYTMFENSIPELTFICYH